MLHPYSTSLFLSEKSRINKKSRNAFISILVSNFCPINHCNAQFPSLIRARDHRVDYSITN